MGGCEFCPSRRLKISVGLVVAVLLLHRQALSRDITESIEQTLFGGITNPRRVLVDGKELLSAQPGQFGTPITAMTFQPVGGLLRNELFSEVSIVPVTSGSTGFVYTYNELLDVFERRSIGLGPTFNERADTMGRRGLALGLSFIRQDFAEFNGEDVSALRIRPGLFARPQSLGTFLDNGSVEALLDLDVTTDTFALWATYGVTDWLDVNLILPLTRIDFRARSTIKATALTEPLPAFLTDAEGNISDFVLFPQGTEIALPEGGKVAMDTVAEEKFGIADMVLRGKARWGEGAWGTWGMLVEMTFPTGNEDNFLGDGALKGRLLTLYSCSFYDGLINLHLNGGLKVTSETTRKYTAEYGSTLDIRVTDRFSVLAGAVGSWRIDPEGLPDNFADGAFGFKANLWRGLVLMATWRIPYTDDGLRSDIIYTAGLEYDL